MTDLLTRSEAEVFCPVIRKLRNLGGAESDAELEAVLKRIKVRARASRGEDIIGPGNASRHFTVLLDGVACSYERLKDGNRQIYAFQYPGDLCVLSRYVLPESNNEVAGSAVTGCCSGISEHKELEQLIAQWPSLGLSL